jgi:hypothetical protein
MRERQAIGSKKMKKKKRKREERKTQRTRENKRSFSFILPTVKIFTRRGKKERKKENKAEE